jgi:FKBP-type peptidyl-prolyl cis-trans isomerase
VDAFCAFTHTLLHAILLHVLNRVIYKDYKEGQGSSPVDGQEVVFDYTGYNESGGVIDSSYRQGRPSQTRLGIAGLIPGKT